jgi:hypothetical protein
VWALPLILSVVACKAKQEPDLATPSERSGYGEAAWAESGSGIQPRAVCEHLARMVAAEAGVSEHDLDPGMLRECEADLAIEAGARGTDNWNAIAACVLQARTDADIDLCDRSHPMPGAASSGPSASPSGAPLGDRELAVCDHMIQIFEAESEAETGEPPPLVGSDRQDLVDECARTLAFEQNPQLDAEAYEQMLQCIEGASSSQQLRTCE